VFLPVTRIGEERLFLRSIRVARNSKNQTLERWKENQLMKEGGRSGVPKEAERRETGRIGRDPSQGANDGGKG